MPTTWTNKSKSTGTTWAPASNAYNGYIPYDSVIHFDSTIQYDGSINTFSNVPKASVTSWTNKPKAT